jgi:ECL1/2/3 zinc binding proteins
MPRSYLNDHLSFFSPGETDSSRDIVPQASPSRPNSMHFSHSPPPTPNTASYHGAAITSLRSLTTRPPSPPSPTTGSGTNFWPFSNHRSAATSPSTSYSRSSTAQLSSTYGNGYGGGYYSYDASLGRMDRPLPPSRQPSRRRPQSIELLTPIINGR